MPDFVYPTNAEIMQISQDKLPRLTADRPAFKLFPIVTKEAGKIIWEQRDNYRGLQQVRGLGGAPTRVKRIGGKTFELTPGAYGEFVPLDEEELTNRRALGDPLKPVDITDLVMEAEEQLTQRFLDRVEVNTWTLITTGTFSVAHPVTGAILHTDSYTTQAFTATVPWATHATATPLADLRAIQLKHRGHSVNFGPQATIYMNQTTFNDMIQNSNQSDLGGVRRANSQNSKAALTITEVNGILLDSGLPQIEIYDEGYIDEAGTFQLFIPNAKIAVIGQRPAGQTVGEYLMTRNANNPNAAPGRYMRVIDKGEQHVPRSIDVHDGHNGGHALYFPSAVVMGNV